jgi:hypothetical protein
MWDFYLSFCVHTFSEDRNWIIFHATVFTSTNLSWEFSQRAGNIQRFLEYWSFKRIKLLISNIHLWGFKLITSGDRFLYLTGLEIYKKCEI